LDDGGRAPEQARPKLREVEGQDPAQIDVLVPDWRDTLEHLVRILARHLVDGELQPVRVDSRVNSGRLRLVPETFSS
jgi:hypothetical protein